MQENLTTEVAELTFKIIAMMNELGAAKTDAELAKKEPEQLKPKIADLANTVAVFAMQAKSCYDIKKNSRPNKGYVMHKNMFAICIAAVTFFASATPIEIDTPDAHIIVARPIDMWLGDRGVLEESLRAHQEKTTWYVVKLNDKSWLFSNMPGQDSSTKPIGRAIFERLTSMRFTTPRSSRNSFTIEPPTYVSASEIENVITVQNESFKRSVIASGNPDDLESKIKRKKFFGGILAFSTVALGADKYGTTVGISATLGSGITEGVYNSVAQYKSSMAPVTLPSVTPQDFKAFEIRSVTTAQPERTGQILIGYKTEKTDSTQAEAIINATLALIAAQSTTNDIEASRASDLAQRKVIWSSCVAQARPECKSE
jgi:hypothetical protein